MAQSFLLPALGYSSVRYNTVDYSGLPSFLAAVSAGAVTYSTNGPVGEILELADEVTLASIYGEPTNVNYNDWLNIARVFKYKSNGINGSVKISRAVGDGTLNGALGLTPTEKIATADLTTQRIDNDEQGLDATIVYDTSTSGDSSETVIKFFSKFPTDTVYKISTSTMADWGTVTDFNYDAFNTQPASANEFAVLVTDADDVTLETFIVSIVETDKDGDNESSFLENVINEKSSYIRAYKNGSEDNSLPFSVAKAELEKGVNVAPITSDYQDALALFEDIEGVDINYLIGSWQDSILIGNGITLCEGRGNTSFRWSIPVSEVKGVGETTAVANIVEYTTTTLNRNTTYGAFYGNAILVYDKYNSVNRWISVAGDIVGLRIARNLIGNPWETSEGLTYGQLKDVIKLAFNPKPASQRTLQLNKANPIISKSGAGNVVWGANNYTSIKSALQDINVRELIIHIIRGTKPFLETKLFELLDDITFNLVEAELGAYMEGVEAARGVTAFRLKTDRSDNAINNNILGIVIAFIPTKLIKEVQVTLAISKEGIDLDVLIGS